MDEFIFIVSMTSHALILDIDGLFTHEWRPGRNSGESIAGRFEMDSSGWVEQDSIPYLWYQIRH